MNRLCTKAELIGGLIMLLGLPMALTGVLVTVMAAIMQAKFPGPVAIVGLRVGPIVEFIGIAMFLVPLVVLPNPSKTDEKQSDTPPVHTIKGDDE